VVVKYVNPPGRSRPIIIMRYNFRGPIPTRRLKHIVSNCPVEFLESISSLDTCLVEKIAPLVALVEEIAFEHCADRPTGQLRIKVKGCCKMGSLRVACHDQIAPGMLNLLAIPEAKSRQLLVATLYIYLGPLVEKQ